MNREPLSKPAQLLSLHGGHSDFGDGAGNLEDFAQAAVEAGMRVFSFTEHMPRPEKYRYPDEKPHVTSFDNFRQYVDRARRVQAAYRSRLPILVGAELELIPGLEDFVNDFLAEFHLDFAVGSVHFVNDIGFDFSAGNYRQAIEKSGDMERFCLDYLGTMESMIERIRFQVLAHFDLFKVFSREPVPLTGAMRSQIERLMARIAEKNLLLDINARGLLKPCREIYPSLEILRIARQSNVAVTLGDDSHSPGDVGKNLNAARSLARQAGYSKISFLNANGGIESDYC